MSKVAELEYDIQELYISGMGSKRIAAELGCDVALVLQVIESFGVCDADELSPFSTVNS